MKYAIRLPANDNLYRNVTELLTWPVRRPSHKPVVRYKSFLYQAVNWKTARRVVAKVEFHFGETVPPRRLYRDQLDGQDPGGGALLQQAWHGGTIDQGRQAGGRDDAAFLSPLRANEVRLWLSVIAHNLGNLWRRLALPDQEVVADQLAADLPGDRPDLRYTWALELVSYLGTPTVESNDRVVVRYYAIFSCFGGESSVPFVGPRTEPRTHARVRCSNTPMEARVVVRTNHPSASQLISH